MSLTTGETTNSQPTPISASDTPGSCPVSARARLANEAVSLIRQRRAALEGIGQRDSSSEGRGRTALVTGASSGIGWSMAELLAAKGYDVVVIARRQERVLQLKDMLRRGGRCMCTRCLAIWVNPQAAMSIFDWVVKHEGLKIDVLVNNAGYDLKGLYVDRSWESEERFIRVLSLSVAELCRYFLPGMIGQRWGRIINITSWSR